MAGAVAGGLTLLPKPKLTLTPKPSGIGLIDDVGGVGNPVPTLGRESSSNANSYISPKTLKEQMAMHQVKSNPLLGAKDLSGKIVMNDSRWHATEGWNKMSNNVEGIEIHFNYNKLTGVFDDFKFKK